jgi:hypothetical protein
MKNFFTGVLNRALQLEAPATIGISAGIGALMGSASENTSALGGALAGASLGTALSLATLGTSALFSPIKFNRPARTAFGGTLTKAVNGFRGRGF